MYVWKSIENESLIINETVINRTKVQTRWLRISVGLSEKVSY